MKRIALLLVLISVSLYSQIPAYYNDINLNLTGQALQNELGAKVTNTHATFLSYTPGVWDALKQTDLDLTDGSKVILVYGYNDTDGNSTTDRTRGINNNGGGATDWNREHVYPKSLGSPNLGTEGPGADAHHLRPADVQRNSSRGSRKFADGSGNSGPTAQGHWYPGDEWKGDVARMMMYMYIRYGNRTLPKNVGVGVTTVSDPNMLQLFLEWNAEDPVSQLELQRNPLLENLQGNRNPFIDNPAFATKIWGGPQAEDRFGGAVGDEDTISPTIPMNLTASNTTETSATLSWNASTDNVGVTAYDIYLEGASIASSTTTSFTVSGLIANTTYSFFVRAKDASGNLSEASVVLSVTTQDSTSVGLATELFFSEYVEGSSNNKALEIANFTGGSINLSEYSLKRQTNGSGTWSSGLNLSGTIANNDVYIIANSFAVTTIINNANLISGASAMSFNGNDPVGLFKNNVLIDVIGTFNGGSSNFAKDITLRRKADISSPSTSYQVLEWDSYPQNTFENLGNHIFDGGENNMDTEAPSIPTNVVGSNIGDNNLNLSWNGSTDNVGITGYNVYQDGTFLVATSETNYEVSGLTPGTSYMFTINAYDASGNMSGLSDPVNITTQDIVRTYCSSTGNTVTYEFIDFVGFGGISNTTGRDGGYGDFTSQTGNLSYGSNTIVLSVGFASASYTEHWGVWIDFNRNGIFESSEKVVTGSTSNSGNLSYNFTVPSSAVSGTTRMRVSLKWNGAPTACETFGYGEVEDYNVTIGSSATRAKGFSTVKIDGELGREDKVFSAKIYPNPATKYIQFDMRDHREVNFTLTNSIGRVVRSGTTYGNRVELDGLTAGLCFIKIFDGQRSFSEKIFIK